MEVLVAVLALGGRNRGVPHDQRDVVNLLPLVERPLPEGAAEILNVGKDDNIMFYIDNGEIIIRKVLPEQGDMYKSQSAEFNEWARKRRMEIDLMPDEDIRRMCLEDLNVKIEHQREYDEAMKEYHP